MRKLCFPLHIVSGFSLPLRYIRNGRRLRISSTERSAFLEFRTLLLEKRDLPIAPDGKNDCQGNLRRNKNGLRHPFPLTGSKKIELPIAHHSNGDRITYGTHIIASILAWKKRGFRLNHRSFTFRGTFLLSYPFRRALELTALLKSALTPLEKAIGLNSFFLLLYTLSLILLYFIAVTMTTQSNSRLNWVIRYGLSPPQKTFSEKLPIYSIAF